MDEKTLYRFILDRRNRLIIFFSSVEEWKPFSDELFKCGWKFKHGNVISELTNFIVWIDSDRTLWFTSISANEKPISLKEFKRDYNLFSLFTL